MENRACPKQVVCYTMFHRLTNFWNFVLFRDQVLHMASQTVVVTSEERLFKKCLTKINDETYCRSYFLFPPVFSLPLSIPFSLAFSIHPSTPPHLTPFLFIGSFIHLTSNLCFVSFDFILNFIFSDCNSCEIMFFAPSG